MNIAQREIRWGAVAMAGLVLGAAALAVVRWSSSGSAPAEAPSGTTAPVDDGAQTDVGQGLGTFSIEPAGSDESCPEGFVCTAYSVSCSGVGAAQGVLAVSDQESRGGTVVFFSGGLGDRYWATGQEGAPAGGLFDDLVGRGMTVVQVRWIDPWLRAAPGESPGPARLACRAATTVRWVYDNIHLPIADVGPAGPCGFCLTGNSGGGSEVAYALTRYGLASIVDSAVITSGPPHASLLEGCLPGPSDSALSFGPQEARTIDASYGFVDGNGPCERRDQSFADRWREDSIDVGAPIGTERVQVIIGGDDQTAAPAHGRAYARWLGVEVGEVPGMPHTVQQSPQGIDRLASTFEGG